MRGKALIVAVVVAATVATLLRSPTAAAPWSIEAVTGPGLTPDLVKEALPPTFGALVLNTTEIPGFTFAPPRSFATQSENLAYYDPADPTAAVKLLVNIATLASGISPAAALATLSEENAAAKPVWDLEEQDLAAESPVPYLLGRELNVGGAEFWSLSWGARLGTHLFTVAAQSQDEREGFMRLLVARIDLVALRAEALATATGVARSRETLVARESRANGTEQALATREAAVAATATALAATAAVLATEETAAPDAQATIDALEASGAESEEDLATAQARLEVVQNSVATLEAGQVAVAATGTALAADAGQSAIRPVPVSIPLFVDAIPLLNADANATADLVAQLEEALAPLIDAQCRIGFVITSGGAPTIQQGNQIAEEVNIILAREFPELAEGSGSYSFANVGGQLGAVELLVFTNSGCSVTTGPSPTVLFAPLVPTGTASPTDTHEATSTPRPLPTATAGSVGSHDWPIIAAESGSTPVSIDADPTEAVATPQTNDVGAVFIEVAIPFPTIVTAPMGALSRTASGFLVATGDGTDLAIAAWDGSYIPLGQGYYPIVLPDTDQVLVAFYGSEPEPAVAILSPGGLTPLSEADPNGAYRDVPAGWDGGIPYFERTYVADRRVELWRVGGQPELVWAKDDVAAFTRHPLPVPGGFLIGTDQGWLLVDAGGGETALGGNVPGEVRASVVSPDGQWLAYTDGGTIWVTPLYEPGNVRFQVAGGWVGSGFDFDPTSQFFVVGDGAHLTIYDLVGAQVATIPAPDGGNLGAPYWGEDGIYVAGSGAIFLAPAAALSAG